MTKVSNGFEHFPKKNYAPREVGAKKLFDAKTKNRVPFTNLNRAPGLGLIRGTHCLDLWYTTPQVPQVGVCTV